MAEINSHIEKNKNLTFNIVTNVSKRPKMSQRLYLRAFYKARKLHFLFH